jgi:hypothetical protein
MDKLTLPGAAAQNYRNGDVRHFGPMDVFDSDAVSQATRNLAYRDAVIVDKINELITAINSSSLHVLPIVPVTVTLAPSESLVVARFRIPSGYEAKITTAALYSSVASGVTLTVMYSSETYGESSSYTQIFTLLSGSEINPNTDFYKNGEFVFKLDSISATGTDVNLSALIGMQQETA